ncbi:mucin 5e [Brachyhypopomus gauderio]|uniref:mucin 5e n=1 Tax=Brachyhypopomus gauderio TaxID=698409 RepID=UPI0040417547
MANTRALLALVGLFSGQFYAVSAAGPNLCKTFGSGVFQTFNGTLFHVKSTCAFTLTRFTSSGVDCSISVQRGPAGLMNRVVIMVNKVTTILQDGVVSVEGNSITLPYDHTYQHVYRYGIYIKLKSKILPFSVTWSNSSGGISSLWVQLDQSLVNGMTGMCGRINSTENLWELVSAYGVPDGTCVTEDIKRQSKTQDCEFFSFARECLKTNYNIYQQLCLQNMYPNVHVEAKCAFIKELAYLCGNKSQLWSWWKQTSSCKQPSCAGDLKYQELGSAFPPTCSNPQANSDSLISTCLPPAGMVLNDRVDGFHAVSVKDCPCVHGERTFAPGQSISSKCLSCTCKNGKWACTPNTCPPRCIVEGQHVTTFDGKQYFLPGKCTYVAARGLSWTVTIKFSQTDMSIEEMNLDVYNERYTFAKDSVKLGDIGITDLSQTEHAIVSWQSSMFVLVQTSFGMKMQVQVSPEIQFYLYLPPTERTKGLCGTYNNNTEDDFTTSSSIVENSARPFALSWAVGDCKSDDLPICINSNNALFAEEKCGQLTNTSGVFASCHDYVPVNSFVEACSQRTCQCTSGLEECLCVALGNYAKACASQGIDVGDWRKASSCSLSCKGNLRFSYTMQACNRTCRSISGPDPTCEAPGDPVEGCGCLPGTHLNALGECSPRALCPCSYPGGTVPPGHHVIDGRKCMCENGNLQCSEACDCPQGKVCVYCAQESVKTAQKTCKSLSQPLSSEENCTSGCYCPEGQYEDHWGNCVTGDKCTCEFSGAVYSSGQSVESNCKSCVCNGGKWYCQGEPCPGVCEVFGNGEYNTFDSKWYHFDGHCQYTLVEDASQNGLFAVRVESVPCCDEALTCSRSVSVELQKEVTLTLRDMNVTQKMQAGWHLQTQSLYSVHTVGLYIIISVPELGFTLFWDRHTRVKVQLHARWKGQVRGLCGNFDGKVTNDLLTSSSSLVFSTQEFGNSWKAAVPPCSDVTLPVFPCQRHSYCSAWAQRRCMILYSDTFKDCHLKEDPHPYYEACVLESCSCEFEGKFLGFCTAVAAYAEACTTQNICINWRTPDLCPVYCDYYNEEGQYSWHYEPCGQIKTCGKNNPFTGKLEGCYPRCPPERPFYDENTRKCSSLDKCTCYFNSTIIGHGDTVTTPTGCCKCTEANIVCSPCPPEITTRFSKPATVPIAAPQYHPDTPTIPVITTTTSTPSTPEKTTVEYTSTMKYTTTPVTTTTTPSTSEITTEYITTPEIDIDIPTTTTITTTPEIPTTTPSTSEITTEYITTTDIDIPTTTTITTTLEIPTTTPSTSEITTEYITTPEIDIDIPTTTTITTTPEIPTTTPSTSEITTEYITTTDIDIDIPTTTTITTTLEIPTTTPSTSEITTEYITTPEIDIDIPTTTTITTTPEIPTTTPSTSEITTEYITTPEIDIDIPTTTTITTTLEIPTTTPSTSEITTEYITTPEIDIDIPTTTTITNTPEIPTTTPSTSEITTEYITTSEIDIDIPTTTTITTTPEIPTTTPSTSEITTEYITTPEIDIDIPTTTTITTTLEIPTTTPSTSEITTEYITTTDIDIDIPTTTTITTTPEIPTTTPSTSEITTEYITTPEIDIDIPTTTTITTTLEIPTTTPSTSEITTEYITTPEIDIDIPTTTTITTTPEIPTTTPSTLEITTEYITTPEIDTDIPTTTTTPEIPTTTPSTSEITTEYITTPEIDIDIPTTTTTPEIPTTTPSTSEITTEYITTPEIDIDIPTTTTITTTPEISTTTPSTSEITTEYITTPEIDIDIPAFCMDRLRNQTWPSGTEWTEDCFRKTCRNGVIEMIPVTCPLQDTPQCPRDLMRQVKDEQGCCDIWQCDCQCDIYGDPHYVSFSGTDFDFVDNCTYVLVKEINPRHHLSITVDNYFCDSLVSGSCAKGIVLKYLNNIVTLQVTPSPNGDEPTVEATLNDIVVQPPFEQNGIRFESGDYQVSVFIDKIRSRVSLSPYNTLEVILAMEFFYKNTQGQCGVCGGDSCVRRSGKVENDDCCGKTAYDWIEEDPAKPYCADAPRNVPCGSIVPPTPPSCEAPLCDLLRHELFLECGENIDMEALVQNCRFDYCLARTESSICSPLERLTEHCKKMGVCVSWRNLTNGICDVTCPEGMYFDECRRSTNDVCQGGVRVAGTDLDNFQSGCFCPDNQILAERHKKLCVSECTYCKGPLGEPMPVGATWESNCFICTCNNQTLTEECWPKPPTPTPTCSANSTLVSDCCNNQICVEKTCEYNGKAYKVGDVWTDLLQPCVTLRCTSEGTEIEKRVCPQQSCPEDLRVWDEHHCCYSCNTACSVRESRMSVTVENCKQEVTLPICEGFCQSNSMWVRSGEVLQLEQNTRCCRESSYETRQLSLSCNGATTSYTYKHITGCECQSDR